MIVVRCSIEKMMVMVMVMVVIMWDVRLTIIVGE